MAIGWHEAGSVFRASLDELTELLVAEETLPAVLERVVSLACTAIEACDYASVTWMNQDQPETIVCTNPLAEQIDAAQYAGDAGPCLSAFRDRAVRSVPSMTDGESWPLFREAAITRGVQSSLSLPLGTGEVQLGALNLYGRQHHAFNSVAPDAALLFAKQAAAAVWSARTQEGTRRVIDNLETALESREVIGTAKGIIMANEKVTGEEAFAIVVRASQHRNIKLRDIALEVIETGATPK